MYLLRLTMQSKINVLVATFSKALCIHLFEYHRMVQPATAQLGHNRDMRIAPYFISAFCRLLCHLFDI